MTFRPSYRSIWRVSYPLIIAGISETVVEVTDTVFLAHYGITELAAIGLAGAIFADAINAIVADMAIGGSTNAIVHLIAMAGRAGIPLDLATTHRPGARFGPRAIRAASTNLAWARHWPWPFDPFERLAVVEHEDGGIEGAGGRDDQRQGNRGERDDRAGVREHLDSPRGSRQVSDSAGGHT